MRIAITGARGQLGKALQEVLRAEEIIPLNRPDYDVTEPQVVSAIAKLSPEVVIHTAAMTDVDGCARDPDRAYLVNALGTQNVALACQRCGAAMVHVSTNEVFDGAKGEP